MFGQEGDVSKVEFLEGFGQNVNGLKERMLLMMTELWVRVAYATYGDETGLMLHLEVKWRV